jgi:putative NADH-flavin reductase
MRILVFGASGQTGNEIVRQAVDRGHSVSAFVRTPAKRAFASSVSVLQGDVANAAAVNAAVAGHDAIVSALGVTSPLKHDSAVITGVQHIVRMMGDHNVRRLIYLSFVGVHASRSAVGFVLRYIAPIPLRHEIADHETKEAVIRNSQLDWTIVRPPKLTNGPRTEKYRSGDNIRTLSPVPLMSRADVAHFIVRELEEPKHLRGSPLLLH